MTMKKAISAIAAAVTLSAAAVSSLTFNVSAEGNPALGNACFIGMIGANSCWGLDDVNELSTAAEINGDAQYEVVWDVSELGGTDTLQFLAVSKSPADGVDNFGSATFPDLAVTIDEVWIDDVMVDDYTPSADAVTTSYYEGSAGTTRLYLHDDWAGTGVADLPSDTVITDNIRVKFTVSGLGVEGDSNVTADPEPATYLLGDVDENSVVDAIDASHVLAEYARVATNQGETFSENQQLAADVNGDNVIDAVDASKILAYYAAGATGQTQTWN